MRRPKTKRWLIGKGITTTEAAVVMFVLAMMLIGILDYIGAFNNTVYPILGRSQEWSGRLVVHSSDSRLWSAFPPRWEDGSPCFAPPAFITNHPQFFCLALNPSALSHGCVPPGAICASFYWEDDRVFSYPCFPIDTATVNFGGRTFLIQAVQQGELVQITVRHTIDGIVFRDSAFYVMPGGE